MKLFFNYLESMTKALIILVHLLFFYIVKTTPIYMLHITYIKKQSKRVMN